MNQALFQSWLTLQCQAIPGVWLALARLEGSGPGQRTISATMPVDAVTPDDMQSMLLLAQRGGRAVAASVTSATADTDPGWRFAHPLQHSGRPIGAIVIEMVQDELTQHKRVAQSLQWGNTWLELLLNQQTVLGAEHAGLQELLEPVVCAARFQQAALAAVGGIAHRYGLERVSLGVCRGDRVQPIALSDSSGFSPRSVLAWQLTSVMVEAVTLGGPVNWPQDGDRLPAHRALAEQQADVAVYSVVLRGNEGDMGVITLEKGSGEPFNRHMAEGIAREVQLLGPILALKLTQDESLIRHLGRRIRRGSTGWLLSHRFMTMLPVTAGLAFLLVFLFRASAYRVGGPAELQGAVQRALIAPFDGYVATAHARAGERVDTGFVLAELDDHELRLELRQLEGDRSELNKQYRKALAGLDHAEARILQAQLAQAEARIDLLQQHLARTRLVAPFAAVVVSGDLSRSLGKPVERGEVLFELAPLDAYRVALEVRDRDIAAIAPGQLGTLVLAALPNERLPIRVVNLTSVPDSGAEAGRFRVEARLMETPDALRPGMRGIGKIVVGERRRIWIWTHELFDWLRYQAWAWLP